VTRPPLAGPYAFSKLPKPVDDLPKVRKGKKEREKERKKRKE